MANRSYHPRKPLEDRLWPRVEVLDNGCWVWTGALLAGPGGGYGLIRAEPGKPMRLVHVVVYERLVGLVPAGLELDHLCRNRACCNPAHLEPVVKRTNILRGVGPAAVNARKTACIRGHAFDRGNTIVERRRDGRLRRRCRSCTHARTR